MALGVQAAGCVEIMALLGPRHVVTDKPHTSEKHGATELRQYI